MIKPLFELKAVTKIFDKEIKPISVLKNLDFFVPPGAFISIQGASGAGKSTLLNLMGLLDSPDDGQVLFKGEQVQSFSDAQVSRIRNKELGFVFQFHHLLGDFSAWENILLPLRIGGQITTQQINYARELVKWVKMEQRLNHLPAELSGGERQRIALVRALVNRPSLLLADEPSGNLDSQSSTELHSLLKEINEKQGLAIVVATHDSKLAQLAHTQMVLADGLLHVQS